MREGHVPTLLSTAASSVSALGVGDLADAESVRRALEGAECVVADAERQEDLEALVQAVPDPSRVLWVGSAGLALALGTVYPGPHPAEKVHPAPARAVLVVVGSLSGASREQLRRLVGERGCATVPATRGKTRAVREAIEESRAALAEERLAAVRSPDGRSMDPRVAVSGLADVAAALADEGLFDALVLTGGSTAVSVARRLGASGIRLEGEVEPGVPFGTLVGPRPYPVVTKAGGFGGPETLVNAVETLMASGKGSGDAWPLRRS